MIGKWQNLIADDLTGFMTLARDDHNIARARHLNGGGALVFTTHQEIALAPDRLQRLQLGA